MTRETNLVLADSSALHNHLLIFTADSDTPVLYNGTPYTVSHTQYASYDTRTAFRELVRHTDLDPRYDTDFDDEASDVAEDHIDACFTNMDRRHHYTNREYFEPNDIRRAATDYQLYFSVRDDDTMDADGGEMVAMDASPSSRADAIADIFSLMNANEASMMAYTRFRNAEYNADDDDHHQPDENVDVSTVPVALRATAYQHVGPSALTQPNPTFELANALYEIYDEVGTYPIVRDVYGILVDPNLPSFYDPDDALNRSLNHSMGQVMSSMMGRPTDDIDKWVNPDEPPLETLDSYKERNQS